MAEESSASDPQPQGSCAWALPAPFNDGEDEEEGSPGGDFAHKFCPSPSEPFLCQMTTETPLGNVAPRAAASSPWHEPSLCEASLISASLNPENRWQLMWTETWTPRDSAARSVFSSTQCFLRQHKGSRRELGDYIFWGKKTHFHMEALCTQDANPSTS